MCRVSCASWERTLEHTLTLENALYRHGSEYRGRHSRPTIAYEWWLLPAVLVFCDHLMQPPGGVSLCPAAVIWLAQEVMWIFRDIEVPPFWPSVEQIKYIQRHLFTHSFPQLAYVHLSLHIITLTFMRSFTWWSHSHLLGVADRVRNEGMIGTKKVRGMSPKVWENTMQ